METMTSATAKSPLPVNPRVLHWARQWAGRSIEEVAGRLKLPPEQIEAWEDEGSSRAPTVRQARLLADFYERHFLEFFLEKIPKIREPVLIPDFRLYRGAADPRKSLGLNRLQAWAETQRVNALDLFGEIGETPPQFPVELFATVSDDVEQRAILARKILQFPISDQLALGSDERDRLPDILRYKLESIGTLTFKVTMLTDLEARGFCLAEFPLPVITFGKESPRAQAFTIMHEFAHLLLKQSSISGAITRTGGSPAARRIERWCNDFSAAFLMPKSELERVFPKPSQVLESIDDDFLRRIANRFSVSDHAALVRLVNLGFVDEDYYWEKKRADFESYESTYKGGGIAKYYGTRYKNKLGNLYTSLVIQAWMMGRITNHNAAEFMGIKNLKHLRDIRAEYQR
jgi:Zn-dependent peptidase ImmA (M78 family)/transcriptional regulator with XRE-family HTH domain